MMTPMPSADSVTALLCSSAHRVSLEESQCQEKASHFQVLDCLWQIRQLDVLEIFSLNKSDRWKKDNDNDNDTLICWGMFIFLIEEIALVGAAVKPA